LSNLSSYCVRRQILNTDRGCKILSSSAHQNAAAFYAFSTQAISTSPLNREQTTRFPTTTAITPFQTSINFPQIFFKGKAKMTCRGFLSSNQRSHFLPPYCGDTIVPIQKENIK
jgi:streptogramin lyase